MQHSFFDVVAIFGAEYLYLLLLLVALVWYLKQPRAAQKEMVVWGIVALPVMLLLLVAAGHIYFDPRPFVVDHFQPLIPHGPDNGFPSDHTLLCSATAAIVWLQDRRWGAVLWLLTALVGASRVYTGVHHSLDIVASAVMAFSVSYLVWTFVLPQIRKTDLYNRVIRV